MARHASVRHIITCILSISLSCHAQQGETSTSGRQATESYDYIVVGGGQSGLVIANRLSEDPSKTVLVVEYGHLDNNIDILRPWQFPFLQRNLFNVTSVPQPRIKNRQTLVYAAAVVGGGSAVNAQFLDRGSADDYDNWEKLGNAGWGWNGLLPYFKKSTTFHPPEQQLVSDFNITYDAQAAYGTDGPIHASFPPWQWPTLKNEYNAFVELGAKPSYEGAGGAAYGVFWVPAAQDPSTQTRSYSRTGYYDPIASRKNLKLLTGHRVNEVLFNANKRAEAVTIQPLDGANRSIITVKASREIVLCAGFLHDPQILQRSGVGPAALLQEAKIPVLVDLPGVGSNLQDHAQVPVSHLYTKDKSPNAANLTTNQTFASWAQQEYDLHKRGPFTTSLGNAAAFLPLQQVVEGYQDLIKRIEAQNATSLLPSTYNAEQVKGYLAQRDLLLKAFASPKSAILEYLISGKPDSFLVVQKGLGRGTVKLNTTDRYAEPLVDYNSMVNPVDMEIFVAMIKYMRKWNNATSMREVGSIEVFPNSTVATDKQIEDWIAENMQSSLGHSSGTSSMIPRELGGVVGPDLLVYGVKGLSVADVSIIPMIPSTHLCATVYAIAEKAADIIKKRAAESSAFESHLVSQTV